MAITLELARHEARILGRGAFGMPVLVLAGVGTLAAASLALGGATEQVARLLSGSLELGLPLLAGLLAAAAVGRDPARELRLAQPTPYMTTAGLRVALTAAWCTALSAAAAIALAALDLWSFPQALLVGQLSWLAPLAWFVAAGALGALLLRSGPASAGLLTAVWMVENVFDELFESHPVGRLVYLFATSRGALDSLWLENRLTLLALAITFAAVSLWLLRRGDRLVAWEDG